MKGLLRAVMAMGSAMDNIIEWMSRMEEGSRSGNKGAWCCYSLSKHIYSDAKEAEQESGASEISHHRPVHICIGTCQSLM